MRDKYLKHFKTDLLSFLVLKYEICSESRDFLRDHPEIDTLKKAWYATDSVADILYLIIIHYNYDKHIFGNLYRYLCDLLQQKYIDNKNSKCFEFYYRLYRFIHTKRYNEKYFNGITDLIQEEFLYTTGFHNMRVILNFISHLKHIENNSENRRIAYQYLTNSINDLAHTQHMDPVKLIKKIYKWSDVKYYLDKMIKK